MTKANTNLTAGLIKIIRLCQRRTHNVFWRIQCRSNLGRSTKWCRRILRRWGRFLQINNFTTSRSIHRVVSPETTAEATAPAPITSLEALEVEAVCLTRSSIKSQMCHIRARTHRRNFNCWREARLELRQILSTQDTAALTRGPHPTKRKRGQAPGTWIAHRWPPGPRITCGRACRAMTVRATSRRTVWRITKLQINCPHQVNLYQT